MSWLDGSINSNRSNIPTQQLCTNDRAGLVQGGGLEDWAVNYWHKLCMCDLPANGQVL